MQDKETEKKLLDMGFITADHLAKLNIPASGLAINRSGSITPAAEQSLFYLYADGMVLAVRQYEQYSNEWTISLYDVKPRSISCIKENTYLANGEQILEYMFD